VDARDVERLVHVPGQGKLKREHGEPVRVVQQGTTSQVSEREQFDRVIRRIGDMERSGRITIQEIRERTDEPWSDRLIANVPCGTPEHLAEYERLQLLRIATEKRLGLDRLPSGIAVYFRVNDREYVVSPYMRWATTLLCDSLTGLIARGRPMTFREKAIWFLWNYRDKAELAVARLESKNAPFRRRCAGCGRRYSPFVGEDNTVARRGCPTCGSPRFRSLAPRSVHRPFGRVTKRGLQRRFKVSERSLEWILSAEIAPDESVPSQPASTE
jgi:hypothetical protein